MTRTCSSKWIYRNSCIIFSCKNIVTQMIIFMFSSLRSNAWSMIWSMTIKAEIETAAPCFSKTVINTCFHHVHSVNTSTTTWKHCHTYHVNRGFPRTHKLDTRWSKHGVLQNLPNESKRAGSASRELFTTCDTEIVSPVKRRRLV